MKCEHEWTRFDRKVAVGNKVVLKKRKVCFKCGKEEVLK